MHVFSLEEKWGFVTNFYNYFCPRCFSCMRQKLVTLDKNNHIGQVEETHFSFSVGSILNYADRGGTHKKYKQKIVKMGGFDHMV